MFTFGGVVARGTAGDPSYPSILLLYLAYLKINYSQERIFLLLYISFKYETVTGTQQPQQRSQERAYMAV